VQSAGLLTRPSSTGSYRNSHTPTGVAKTIAMAINLRPSDSHSGMTGSYQNEIRTLAFSN
jgi:hypothetical protein